MPTTPSRRRTRRSRCAAPRCNYFATDPLPNAANDPTLSPNPHLDAEKLACSDQPTATARCRARSTAAAAVVAGLWRKGNAAATGKVVNFQCAVNVAGP